MTSPQPDTLRHDLIGKLRVLEALFDMAASAQRAAKLPVDDLDFTNGLEQLLREVRIGVEQLDDARVALITKAEAS